MGPSSRNYVSALLIRAIHAMSVWPTFQSVIFIIYVVERVIENSVDTFKKRRIRNLRLASAANPLLKDNLVSYGSILFIKAIKTNRKVFIISIWLMK